MEIDGADIRHLRLAELRSTVQLVKGIEIFHGTIIENVRVGREQVSVQSCRAFWSDSELETVTESAGWLEYHAGDRRISSDRRAGTSADDRPGDCGRPRLLIVDETLDHVMDARTASHH